MPGWTSTSSRAGSLAPRPVERRVRCPRSRVARSTAAGLAWSGAASARARSSMSATTPPSAAAAERAASRPAASFGTTPSIIAWSWDSRTVAGVARSWAMSLAARRRSISERSRRSAIALNASASSVDSRSSPPVARALASPASSRRAAAATSRNGRVSRPAIEVDSRTITSTLTSPATARVALNTGRKPRSPARAGMSASSVATTWPSSSIGVEYVAASPSGVVTERRQRRPVGRDDPDLATRARWRAASRAPGREPARPGGRAGRRACRLHRRAAAAAGRSAPSGSWS